MVKMDDSLMEEQIKVSQQEIKFIAEFLESFDIDAEEAVTSGPKLSPSSPSAEAGAGANAEAFTHKHLEKVGQYLSSADLDTPANRKKSVWHQFLKDNPQIAKLDGIIVPNEKSSLMSEYKSLRQSVDAVFSDMKTDMTDRCQYLGEIVLPFEGTAGDLICRQFSTADQAAANAPIGADPSERRNMETHEIMGVITQPTKVCTFRDLKAHSLLKTFHLLVQVFDHGQTDGLGTRVFYYELHPPEPARPQHPIFKAVWLSTDQDPQLQMKVVDIDFYTSDTLTLLLGNIPVNDHQRLLQFPLNACETSLRELPLNAFHPIKLSAQATYTLQTKNIFALSDLVRYELDLIWWTVVNLFAISVLPPRVREHGRVQGGGVRPPQGLRAPLPQPPSHPNLRHGGGRRRRRGRHARHLCGLERTQQQHVIGVRGIA
jgi:hypothetical protein